MAKWVAMKNVFAGGSEALKSLRGRKIRATVTLSSVATFNPGLKAAMPHETMDIPLRTEGYIAGPHPQLSAALVAIPRPNAPLGQGLDGLTRSGAFSVAVINWPTLKAQFDVECP